MKHLIVFVFVILNTESNGANEFGTELETEIQEYCSRETFHAQCSSGEVILMNTAIYGRMRIGRCITQQELDALSPEFRSTGCSENVLDFMDRKCTGKTSCDVRVTDVSLETTSSCLPAFLSFYVEMSYRCIKVADQLRSCTVDVSTTPMYIFDWKTCGTMSQPWTVVAPIGQRLLVSKIIIKTALSKDGKINQKCSSSVMISDKVAKVNVTECASGTQREEQMYSTAGGLIEVCRKSSNPSSESEEFILKFQAIGCSDVIPPSDAYLKRQGETIVVGCFASRKSWHLYCEDGKWIGVIGNCSQGSSVDLIDSSSEVQHKVESLSSEKVLWIVVIVGFSASIGLAVICFGAVLLRRLRFKSEQKRDYKTLKHQINPFANQLTLTQTENGAVFLPAANDTQCTASGQPTYSVFVGDDVFNQERANQ